MTDADEAPPRRGRGGRPKGDPDAVRKRTIGVRVSPAEHAELAAKASAMGMTPAQWLRHAALSRRLPPPPAPPINVKAYAELSRLAANLNQLTLACRNAGHGKTEGLAAAVAAELAKLRQAMLGVFDAEAEAEAE